MLARSIFLFKRNFSAIFGEKIGSERSVCNMHRICRNEFIQEMNREIVVMNVACVLCIKYKILFFLCNRWKINILLGCKWCRCECG